MLIFLIVHLSGHSLHFHIEVPVFNFSHCSTTCTHQHSGVLHLLLLFPRNHVQMVRLYHDPKGENIFEKTYNGTTGMMGTHDAEKVTSLEKKVKDLQTQLSVYEVGGVMEDKEAGREM